MFILHWSQQQMRVIGHHDHGMNLNALSVIVKAMLENNIAGNRREGLTGKPAKGHEYRLARLLVVRELATVFILAVESNMFGHRAQILCPKSVHVCDE